MTFVLNRKAKAAMVARFGPIWKPVGAFRTPTSSKRHPEAFLMASARRGGRAGRPSANLIRREEEEEREEEREEQSGEEDSSNDSNVESILGSLEID